MVGWASFVTLLMWLRQASALNGPFVYLGPPPRDVPVTCIESSPRPNFQAVTCYVDTIPNMSRVTVKRRRRTALYINEAIVVYDKVRVHAIPAL